MKVCQIYVGHRRTFWWTEKNHKESLFPVDFAHHRDETSPSFNYYNFQEHPYQFRQNGNTNVRNVLNMWHNRYMAFCSAPEGYDVYVLMRYDISINSPIDLRDFYYDDRVAYIPSDNDHVWGVNDQMIFGTREVIKKYVSINLNHLHLFNTPNEKLYPWFHSESYSTYNLQSQGVDIVRIPQETKIAYDRTTLPSHLLEGSNLLIV